MRFVLALLAVMALLVSPVTAAAAQVACNRDGPAAMTGMDASAAPGMAHVAARASMGDPCCDPGNHHQMNHKICAQGCAASCAVPFALPSSMASTTLAYSIAPLPAARRVAIQGHKPAALERPPKSIA